MISHIPLKDITKSDLENLAETKEGKHIEYKQALPSDKSEKRDFLADVSAFANADGGDILFGVHDKRVNGQSTGLPNFVGLSGINVDQEILKLQNSIRDGLEPPLQVEIREVPGFDQGPVLVVRVRQSWNSPHMIKSTPSFYVRNNNGNNPLGVQEIREVFLRSEAIEKRMREFRDERLGRVLSGDALLELNEGPKAVLHILPFASFSRRPRFTPVQLRELTGISGRPFLEGLVSTTQHNHSFWCQSVFTHGVVELAFGTISIRKTPLLIHAERYEKDAVQYFPEAIATLMNLELAPPYLVSLSLVGGKGCTVWVNQETLYLGSAPRPIVQDVLIAPEILMEDASVASGEVLGPLFDSFWHAAGYFEWPNG